MFDLYTNSSQDGEVSNTTELIDIVYKEASTTRVFTFGLLWTSVDTNFLGIDSCGKTLGEALAAAGK